MKNHLGSYECKLCLTLHNNEGSYLAHTQGKKHQANLLEYQVLFPTLIFMEICQIYVELNFIEN